MTRNHVHMAIGYPGDNQVISGMRQICNVFIEIDVENAMKDGMKFYISKNKVILSSGFNKVIPPRYFKLVTNKKRTKVLFENKNFAQNQNPDELQAQLQSQL